MEDGAGEGAPTEMLKSDSIIDKKGKIWYY
jgi:hypothetical protein